MSSSEREFPSRSRTTAKRSTGALTKRAILIALASSKGENPVGKSKGSARRKGYGPQPVRQPAFSAFSGWQAHHISLGEGGDFLTATHWPAPTHGVVSRKLAIPGYCDIDTHTPQRRWRRCLGPDPVSSFPSIATGEGGWWVNERSSRSSTLGRLEATSIGFLGRINDPRFVPRTDKPGSFHPDRAFDFKDQRFQPPPQRRPLASTLRGRRPLVSEDRRPPFFHSDDPGRDRVRADGRGLRATPLALSLRQIHPVVWIDHPVSGRVGQTVDRSSSSVVPPTDDAG